MRLAHDSFNRAPPPPPAGARPVTVIEPRRAWQTVNLAELWQYRDLFRQLVRRDVAVRYKQTLLGAAWAVLQPAMMMVVFALFFGHTGRVSSGDTPYPLFVYAGLLPWTFFATAVTAAAQSVVGSERLITKIYFPRLAIPLAAVGAAAVDALVASALLAALMAWYHVPLRPTLLLAPPVLFAVALAAAGVGTLFAALNVAYRDVRYVIPFLIQIGMFATPTIYTQTSSLSAGTQPWLSLNPMVGLVASFRAAALGHPIPWPQFITSSTIVLILLLAGCLYFRRVEDTFADTI
jgi:lipopolysaccharide transport system permease protein